MTSETTTFGTVTREGHDSTKFYSGRLYNNDSVSKRQIHAPEENELEEDNLVYCADSRNMIQLPSDSVHLMITSPPYNVGKDYDTDMSLDEYIELLRDVLVECYRVLVEGGRACVNIANVGRSPYIPLHAFVMEIARTCGFYMRGEIIWDKGASAGSSCAWGSWKSASNPVLRDVHEYILVFCKGTFNRHRVRKDSIERDDFLECTKSIWSFPTASAKKLRHPAPFPLELPRRLIHLYSFVGDIVLDPFMGSGTTAVAALQSDRRFVGYEIDESYVQISQERILEASQSASHSVIQRS